MGVATVLVRKIKRFFNGLADKIWDVLPLQRFRRSKKKSSRRKRSRRKEWEEEEMDSRSVRRIPGYRTFKRLLAFGLLGLNLIFSQFILGSQTQGQIMFLMFLANSFILADYLWKTRKRES